MDNNTTNPASENTKVDLNKTVSDSVPETTQPAFDYQPPTVEAPEPPEVNVPTQTAAASASEIGDIPPQTAAVSTVETSDIPTQKADAPAVDNSQQYAQQQPYQQQPYQQQPYQQQSCQQQPYQQQPYQQQAYQQQPYQQQPYQQQAYQQQPYQQQPYQQQSYQQSINQQPYYQYAPVDPSMVSQQNTSDGFAIASLICSIIGLIACCTVLPSLLGIIFAAISKIKNDGTRPTGVSTAGLILGIIGSILNFIVLLGMIYAS